MLSPSIFRSNVGLHPNNMVLCEWNSQSGVCESGVLWVLHQFSHISHNCDAPKQCGRFNECEQLEWSGLYHSSHWSILSGRVLGPLLGIFCVLICLHLRKWHAHKLFLSIFHVDKNKEYFCKHRSCGKVGHVFILLLKMDSGEELILMFLGWLKPKT